MPIVPARGALLVIAGRKGEPYKYWTDGKTHFAVAQWEVAGFKVSALDRNDDDFVRKMAHTLRWNGGSSPMDLTNDLFAHYTLVEKPKK